MNTTLRKGLNRLLLLTLCLLLAHLAAAQTPAASALPRMVRFSGIANDVVNDSHELTAGQLTEELRHSFRSKNFVVPEITVCCPDVRSKHIDSFTKTMLKTATDSILLLGFARWNG
jgi:hypothetical protein